MSETANKPEEAAITDEAAEQNETGQEVTASSVADEMVDWGEALAEQAKSEVSEELDWGAAMAEQAKLDEPASDGTADEQRFPDYGAELDMTKARDIDFILDIPVQMTVELGRTKLPIKNLLQLAQGSVVELDGLAGEPMDVLINGCLIAQGEVVVVNDKFGIRLTDVITPAERIRKLNR